MKKTFCAVSLCVSFCAAISPSDTEKSQNAAVESKQISQNSNKIAAVSQNKAVNSKNSNLQISQNKTKLKNTNLKNDKNFQILSQNANLKIKPKGDKWTFFSLA